jgi:hypothetical protein
VAEIRKEKKKQKQKRATNYMKKLLASSYVIGFESPKR